MSDGSNELRHFCPVQVLLWHNHCRNYHDQYISKDAIVCKKTGVYVAIADDKHKLHGMTLKKLRLFECTNVQLNFLSQLMCLQTQPKLSADSASRIAAVKQ